MKQPGPASTDLFNGRFFGYVELLPDPGGCRDHQVVALGGRGLCKVTHAALLSCTTVWPAVPRLAAAPHALHHGVDVPGGATGHLGAVGQEGVWTVSTGDLRQTSYDTLVMSFLAG